MFSFQPSDILVFCQKSFNVTLLPPNLEINQNIQNKMIRPEGEEESQETNIDRRGWNNKDQDSGYSLNKALGIDSVLKQKDHYCYINSTFFKEFNRYHNASSGNTNVMSCPSSHQP
jgi:hypothetical protein